MLLIDHGVLMYTLMELFLSFQRIDSRIELDSE